MQSVRAESVLPGHELLLVLLGITAHQEPVRWLAAWVSVQRELAELNGGGEVMLFEVYLGQALDGLEVQLLEPTLLGNVPVAVPVIFKERPAVKSNRSQIGIDHLLSVAITSG